MFLAKTRSLEISLFTAYVLLLLLSNIVYDFVMWPFVVHPITNPYLQTFVGLLWSIIFWIVPTFLYIIYVNRRNPFDYLKLTTNIGRGLLWGLAGILYFVLAVCFRHFLQGASINFHLSFNTWLNMVIFVGFIEEIPVRGLIFQKLNEFMGFWRASALGSFIFVCLHIPYWISTGKSFSSYLYTALYIFVFAMILCFTLKRSESLWGCIIIHSVNDLVSLIV